MITNWYILGHQEEINSWFLLSMILTILIIMILSYIQVLLQLQSSVNKSKCVFRVTIKAIKYTREKVVNRNSLRRLQWQGESLNMFKQRWTAICQGCLIWIPVVSRGWIQWSKWRLPSLCFMTAVISWIF